MKLIRLKEPLDGYHQRRADKHGYLYWMLYGDEWEVLTFRGARSIATGAVCTLEREFLEFVDDDPQLQG